jgi:phenylalanyl-tRNA synthetase alpha subunit
MSGTLTVNEIYLSLQGESTFAGLPCIFVRLTACNLRCSYCDSAYAFIEGKKQTLEEVLAEVRRLAATFSNPKSDLSAKALATAETQNSKLLLRTHTSSVQIRVMEKQPPPVRIIVPGRVYRRDNADATHNPAFQQVEGLYVDKGVTAADLKGTVEFVFRELMGEDVKIRFRPHYFSYTEPSFEIDFTSALVKKMGKDWLEIAGCGMVHPKVFENVGYDPEVWTGWAFGFGIERIAMIRYGINDIRLFYENDVRFLKQF